METRLRELDKRLNALEAEQAAREEKLLAKASQFERGEPLLYEPPPHPGFDLAMKITASIQPDGGLPGADEDKRLLRTIVAVAFMLAAEAEGRPMFRPHLARLLAYIKSAMGSLRKTRRMTMARAVRLAERRIAPGGDWFTEVAAIVEGHNIKAETLWQKLACATAI